MPFSRWLLLTIPGFVISAVLLAFTIRSLLRTLSGAAVISVPAQALDFAVDLFPRPQPVIPSGEPTLDR